MGGPTEPVDASMDERHAYQVVGGGPSQAKGLVGACVVFQSQDLPLQGKMASCESAPHFAPTPPCEVASHEQAQGCGL